MRKTIPINRGTNVPIRFGEEMCNPMPTISFLWSILNAYLFTFYKLDLLLYEIAYLETYQLFWLSSKALKPERILVVIKGVSSRFSPSVIFQTNIARKPNLF
jgi:hypothetical protein